MKFALTLLAFAAAATEAPVISLDLEGMGGLVSKANDHHDGQLAVSRQITLVRCSTKDAEGACKKGLNYNQRSEYIVKYNAQDKSGNKADQVVFAIILQDHQRPVIALSYQSKTVEALKGGLYFNALPTATATDNIDDRMTIKDNAKKINTHNLGSTTFNYNTKDFARVFGVDGRNNKAATKKVTITVVDTTKPVITQTGPNPTVQCSKGYTDAGATCLDTHDSYANGKLHTSILQSRVTTKSHVNQMKTGTYGVYYGCKDFQNLAAATVKRTVKVIDTIKPKLTICTGGSHSFSRGSDWSHSGSVKNGQGCLDHHVIQHSAGYTRDVQIIQFISDGSKQVCNDDCCGKRAVKTSWHTGSCSGPTTTFNTLKPASYFVKYSCTDCNALTTTKCRTLINEDHTKPIIDILGNDLMTIEATFHKNYVDDGATCSDQVDGVISQQVEVSGDVVNLSKVGTYKITYKCKDAAGNAADSLTRTVVVKDTTCPTCKLNGDKKTQKVVREASFPYSDLGATCTDNIDGARPTKRTGTFNVETTGTYVLTYSASDKSGNTIGKGKCKHTTRRTIVVKDTLKPVSPSTSVARRSTSP